MTSCCALAPKRDERSKGTDMTPDPDRKPTKAEMRQGGMVATAVLVFIAIFTIVIVWIA